MENYRNLVANLYTRKKEDRILKKTKETIVITNLNCRYRKKGRNAKNVKNNTNKNDVNGKQPLVIEKNTEKP